MKINYDILRGGFKGVKIALQTQHSVPFKKKNYWLKGIVTNVCISKAISNILYK